MGGGPEWNDECGGKVVGVSELTIEIIIIWQMMAIIAQVKRINVWDVIYFQLEIIILVGWDEKWRREIAMKVAINLSIEFQLLAKLVLKR